MSKPYTKRSRSGYRWSQNQWDHTNPAGITAYGNMSWENSADGVSNPHYKEQIANNVSATTPFSAKEISVEHTDGYVANDCYVTALGDIPSARRIFGCKGNLQPTDYSSLNLVNVDSVNAAASIADSKFYNKASGIIKALEGGELLGETHKTATAILRKSTQVFKFLTGSWRQKWNSFLSSGRKGNREANFKRVIAFASDNYLEWKFGVDPLLKDIQALAHELKDDFLEVETFTSRGSATGVGQYVSNGTFGIPTLNLKTSVVTVEESSIQYKAAIRLRRYGVGGLAERLGLSPSNFVPTLYNLMPWSWLLDYATNVGDVVTAICFDPAKIAWCNRTVRRKATLTLLAGVNPKVDSSFTSHPGYPIASPSKTVWTVKFIDRSYALPMRVPTLHGRYPDFQTEAGRTKWLNIAAVMSSQAFGSNLLTQLGAAPE